MDEYSVIPAMMGARDTRFIISVLELNHDGLMRTNLFGHPRWSSSDVCVTYEQWLRWEVDDVDVFAFSADSSVLSTPAGLLSMSSGKIELPWTYTSDKAIWGGKISKDFGTLAIVRDWKTVELMTPRDNRVRDRHTFAGVVHILSISEHCRFLLLLLVKAQPHSKDNSGIPKTGSRATIPQDGFIGVFDWKKKHWTPLLEVNPPVSRSLASWEFGKDITAKFGPESTKTSETNQVVLQCPAGWKHGENVRCDPAVLSGRIQERSLIDFRSEKLREGFGSHPTLVSLSHIASLS